MVSPVLVLCTPYSVLVLVLVLSCSRALMLSCSYSYFMFILCLCLCFMFRLFCFAVSVSSACQLQHIPLLGAANEPSLPYLFRTLLALTLCLYRYHHYYSLDQLSLLSLFQLQMSVQCYFYFYQCHLTNSVVSSFRAEFDKVAFKNKFKFGCRDLSQPQLSYLRIALSGAAGLNY